MHITRDGVFRLSLNTLIGSKSRPQTNFEKNAFESIRYQSRSRVLSLYLYTKYFYSYIIDAPNINSYFNPRTAFLYITRYVQKDE